MAKASLFKYSAVLLFSTLMTGSALSQSQSDHTMRPGIAPTSRIKQSIPVITYKDNVIARQVTENQQTSCPSGYTGSITMSRNRMDYLQPQAPSQFSQWVQSSSSCSPIFVTTTDLGLVGGGESAGGGGSGGESGPRGSFDSAGNHVGNQGNNGGFNSDGSSAPGGPGTDPGSF